MFDRIIDCFGRIDVLINNAGINIDKAFLEMTDAEWTKVINTILTGTFICSQEFSYHFRGQNGHIINIGAHTGIQGRKNGINYCSAKAGVISATKCLALELAPRIKVNCVHPGMVRTDELVKRLGLHIKANLKRRLSCIPLGRLGEADEVFKVINFLVTDTTFITGQGFFVNGGQFMP
jgi:NAD(P)-dependent dehydrogenase (short-subunit alcohol dehydrogenase family)